MLPPSATDTIVMLPAVLRKVVSVTVAAPPDSIASGTDDPSLRISAPDIVIAPPAPATLTGESVSTHPAPTAIRPEVADTIDPISVPPERLSSLPELPVTTTSTNELSIKETTPTKVKLPPSISTRSKLNCPPTSTLI
jgi:hypothetical protein